MNERSVIAKNLKQMREASGFTQEGVAGFLNVGRSAYSNYESGIRDLPLCLMERLADLYGCEIYLFYEEDSDVVENMLTTAFRVDDLSIGDMHQLASFKRIVKNSLKMDLLLER